MKYYIVCSADNIGYELTVSKPVTTYDEAQKIMSEEMEEVLSNIEEEEIESKNISRNSFHILCNNSDVFYGQIKGIEPTIKKSIVKWKKVKKIFLAKKHSKASYLQIAGLRYKN